MADFHDQDEINVQAYHSSLTDIFLRVQELFVTEKLEHRRINRSNIIERTAAATGVKKDLI